MALDSNSLDAQFIVDWADKKVNIKDIFDFATEGIALTDVTGVCTLRHTPTATLFHQNTDYNTPDINHDVSLESIQWDLPTDAQSAILSGEYSFLYSVRRSFSVNANGQQVIASTNTIKLIGDQSALLEALDTIVISGSGAGNDGTWTVVTATENSGNTDVVVSEVGLLSDEGSGFIGNMNYDEEYTKTFLPCIDFTLPVGVLETVSDCNTYKIQATDKSDYNGTPTIVYANVMKYPTVASGGQPADEVYTAAEIISGPPIYTGAYEFQLIATATYTLADSLVIVALVTATQSHVVNCDDSLCNLADCFDSLIDAHEKASNCGQESGYEDLILTVNGKMNIHQTYIRCGKTDKAKAVAAEILVLIGEAPNCDCVTSTPDGTILQPTGTYYLTTADLVSFTATGNTTSVNVQDAIEEIQSEIDALPTAVVGNRFLGAQYGEFTSNPGAFTIPANTLADGDEILIDMLYQNSDAGGTLALYVAAASRAVNTTGVAKANARMSFARSGADASSCDVIIQVDTGGGYNTTETLSSQDLTANYDVEVRATGSSYNIISPRYTHNVKV